ncbi:MAG: heavy metal translocating P-type ATPase [Kiritimatiellia bacterium]
MSCRKSTPASEPSPCCCACSAPGKGFWAWCSTPQALALSALSVLTGVWLEIKGAQNTLSPALIAALICGLPIAREAAESLFRRRRIVVSLLIAIGIISALAIGEFLAAGEVALLMAIGEALERRAAKGANQGLESLIRLRDSLKSSLVPGAEFTLGPGEAVPCDATVLDGESQVDQSIVTGEARPIRKGPGDRLWQGSLNGYGRLRLRADAVGEDATVRKLLRLAEAARARKAPVVRLADRWAERLVPAALLLAFLTGAILLWIGVPWCVALHRGVAILVTFCPCALALATPTAIYAAISRAAKDGVLVKSGQALETAASLATICFDKTGTLTSSTWGNRLRRDADGRLLDTQARQDDPIRPEAPGALAALRTLGIRTVLLSGDTPEAVQTVAQACAIEDARSSLLPEDKLRLVEQIAAREAPLAFVGDGINDAAAMSRANLGIAMAGSGTDVAAEAADIALLRDNLDALPALVRLARRTLCVIRFNIAIAFLVNLLALSACASGHLGPAGGAFLHNAGSLLVVLNAARLAHHRQSANNH